MTVEQRATLRQRFEFRCGYCGVSESEVGAELTVDHFQPVSRAGSDTPENWVYCCFACNSAKGNYWQPESVQRVLHPQLDRLGEHIAAHYDGTLVGLTETGRFHIEQLRLNRPALVQHRLESRRREQEAQRHTEILRSLLDASHEIDRLRRRLEQRLGG